MSVEPVRSLLVAGLTGDGSSTIWRLQSDGSGFAELTRIQGEVRSLAVGASGGRAYAVTGEQVVEFDSDGGSPRAIFQSQDLESVVQREGALIVAQYATGTLWSGEVRGGCFVQIPGRFAFPRALAARGGSLYGLETGGSARIVYAKPSGEWRIVATGFSGPTDLALQESGGLLVADASAGQVVEVNPQSGEKRVLLSGLSGPRSIAPLSGSLVIAEVGAFRQGFGSLSSNLGRRHANLGRVTLFPRDGSPLVLAADLGHIRAVRALPLRRDG